MESRQHKGCGGTFSKHWTLSYYGDSKPYLLCSQCGRSFWDSNVLVWVVDPFSKMRHTELRPICDADGLERCNPVKW